ncbi:ROK family transcriptional regulator [Humibacter sp. RRB41]|uniref:ROK family transcriptional regulator n=1 Tax=Humibacter sp. RRB41 TaxID=2919946 RepID=UPI001FAA59A9|nr:ROK family transcriptional regulator [Humibacter sp. RRB41]
MEAHRRTPGSQTSLREANRGRIVDAVKKYGGLSQIELAGLTGLSPATVSNIVKELSGAGVLTTAPGTRSGRRAQNVTLAHALGLVAGVHYSTRHLRIAVSDASYTVVAETHMPLAKDHRADSELDRLTLLLADMLESAGAGMLDLLAVGVALPAPVDQRTGTVARRGILRGWDGVEVADVLQRSLKRPVFVDTDANAAALGELRMGAARGKNDVVYVDVGDRIGAGLVLGGRVYSGHGGMAGELGHTVIQEDGPPCECGNRGCVQAIAGGNALIQKLQTGNRGLKLQDVIVRAMAGDSDAIRAIADAGTAIGVATANLSNLLDPERIVIGGELGRAGELLLGPMRREVERAVLAGTRFAPEIVQSQLGQNASAMGAMAMAVDRVSLNADETQIATSQIATTQIATTQIAAEEHRE